MRVCVPIAAVGSRGVGTGLADSHLQDGGFVVGAGQQDQVILQVKRKEQKSAQSCEQKPGSGKGNDLISTSDKTAQQLKCGFQAHQQDSLSFDQHGPGSRVQNKRLHKVVLGNVYKLWFHAGSKDNLLGLFRA